MYNKGPYLKYPKKEIINRKKLTVKKGSECMACLQCVQACSEAFCKVNDVTKSCIQIVAGKNGGAKLNVCIQCGKCAKVCPMEVLEIVEK